MLAFILALTAAGPQTPIFQPGAPGAASRVITASEAAAMGRTTYNAADAQFMQHMIVHHGQAVEMVALLDAHGESETVKRLGRRIAMSQEAEIALMRGWLVERGQAEAPADPHAHHHMPGMDMSAMDIMPSDTPVMPGMLSPAQMARLAEARGAAFDRLFLQGMIQHHQGALDMVDGLLAQNGTGEDPMLSEFLTSVVADQSAEILRMQSLLSEPEARDPS